MHKLTLLLATVLSAAAFAQADVGAYSRALGLFNANDNAGAAAAFFELAESSTDAEIRAKSEYQLARSLERSNLPMAALIQYASIVKAGKGHPHYLDAVKYLVDIQSRLEDQDLVPSLLNNAYSPEDWALLPDDARDRVNYLIGIISQRKSKLDEAQSFLEVVPANSPVYAKAQYLLGLVFVDERHPGGAQPEEAIKAFETVLNLKGNYEDLVQLQQLATLGLGRTYYGLQKYEQASQAYERIPRFSRYWDQALFENGFARFQADDYGGALGSLQALHAPQFTGAFQPESWVLKATAYYFSCLYEESKNALAAFDEVYLPMLEKLKPLVEGEDKDLEFYYRLVTQDSDKLPPAVALWIKSNERLLSSFNLLAEVEREKKAITDNDAWRSSRLPREFSAFLDQQRATLVQVAGSRARARVNEAYKNIQSFGDQAEIIRFETSKAEKELFEAGVDQQKLLSAKPLYRPKMPAENWNYWKFQGEFWRDEIGYYQYTLKRGCPARAGE